MRLITRCPQCETTFRVIPDQLKLAEGWVRCGRCTRVFEAQQHLYELPVATSPAPVIAQPVDEVSALPSLKKAAQPTSWGWLVSGLVLSLALACQWLFQARHVVAAQLPELRQPLQAICQALGCELNWPLDLQAIALISSSFEQREAGHYRLTLQWRNTQTYPVATPSVELSLTDTQDQIVVRKVLTPQMLALPAAVTSGALKSMAFDLEGDAPLLASVVGYHVMLFYP